MEPKNISKQQRELLDRLSSSHENFMYEWDEIRGILSFVRADSLAKAEINLTTTNNQNHDMKTLEGFMKNYELLLGNENFLRNSKLLTEKKDHIGWHHYQLQQFHSDRTDVKEASQIEIYGSKLAAHFKPNGTLVEVQSSCYKEIKTINSFKVSLEELQRNLLAQLSNLEGFEKLQAEMRKHKETLFPLMQKPRPVIYPWQGEMLNAYATYGYAPFTFSDELKKRKENKPTIAFGQMFFNAESGEMFLFAPTQKGAENPTTGSGLGCTPLGGPYVNRSLDVVRVDATSTYLLKNKTKARDIITFDANGNSAWASSLLLPLLNSGTIPVSTDNDGDNNWNRVAANTTDAERTASQQPEVDEHFIISELYDWYSAIGGRVGWDDNDFAAPLVPNQNINVVAHTYDDGAGTSRSVNANFNKQLVGGHWISRLAFFDGDPTGATDPSFIEDYLAGSEAIVGHEYQHAVTDFSFKDGAGNPGLTYSDWFAAIHEGTSDVFGGLFSGNWWMGTNISPTGQIFRNLAFPRDSAALDPNKFDHWDDRNNITGSGARYHRGDILAHCAYLMAQGGVHQRSSRTPVLVPVRGMGRETVGGKDVYKAARIWYRGLSLYLSNIGAMTGIPTNDENIFRNFRNATVSAAIDLYGTNSLEHKTTVLAWYAVGLHPAGTNYGADVTFLTWGADWWMSRPYIGLSSPDWSSVDLFINNGGTSEWNAKINIIDAGMPTQFENKVYCRVRNVGNLMANNVQVQFEYAKCTTSGATWLPMTDKDGNIQVLNLGNLSAGTSNFPDSNQNTPPASAMVKWWIAPLEIGETVNHFCIRAKIFSVSDVNTFNNEVQSNVAYAPYVPGEGFRFGFFANNPFNEAIAVDLKLTNSLPRNWNIRLIEQTKGLILKPNESKRVHLVIDTPQKLSDALQAPFDGNIIGHIMDTNHSNSFSGNLFKATLVGDNLKAQISMNTEEGNHIMGLFDGQLDVNTAKFKGKLSTQHHQRLMIEGCLRPQRVINIGQYHRGEPLGGISVQVQVPLPKGSCFEEFPSTNVYVEPEITKKNNKDFLEDAKGLLEHIKIDKENVCSVKLKSILVEIKFKEESC